MTYHYIPAMVE